MQLCWLLIWYWKGHRYNVTNYDSKIQLVENNLLTLLTVFRYTLSNICWIPYKPIGIVKTVHISTVLRDVSIEKVKLYILCLTLFHKYIIMHEVEKNFLTL